MVGPLNTTEPTTISFSHSMGLTNIGIDVKGPGEVTRGTLEQDEGATFFTWTYPFTFSQAGFYDATFTSDDASQEATCEFTVVL